MDIIVKDRGGEKMRSTALILMIIGAINWGLIGLFRLNLVDAIFGEMSLLSRIIYVLVGIAGLYGFTMFGERQVEK